jgi:hypothetical protein
MDRILKQIMDKKSEGITIIWFRCLYRLRKSLNFCQNFTIAKLLEVIKYKITSLKLSQLTKGILQYICIYIYMCVYIYIYIYKYIYSNGETTECTDWVNGGIIYLLLKSADSK